MDAQAIIESREGSHGNFVDQSVIAQNIKDALRDSPHWQRLATDQQEAMEMIAVKMSRIANGDPDHVDHWLDIQGYAKLVQNRLEKGTSL